MSKHEKKLLERLGLAVLAVILFLVLILFWQDSNRIDREIEGTVRAASVQLEQQRVVDRDATARALDPDR